MWFLSFWNWFAFAGGIWNTLEQQTTEILECSKQSLMGDSDRCSED
jgi:hypothetical protein